MSYQAERDQFIDRVRREGLPLEAAYTLLRQATTINRLAELACSSEAADRDRIPCPQTGKLPTAAEATSRYPCLCDYDGHHTKIPRITLQDWQAERRAKAAVPDGWAIITAGDPRGYVLRVIPPSYAERNANRPAYDLDAIGVPSGPSGLRF